MLTEAQGVRSLELQLGVCEPPAVLGTELWSSEPLSLTPDPLSSLLFYFFKQKRFNSNQQKLLFRVGEAPQFRPLAAFVEFHIGLEPITIVPNSHSQS